MSARPEWNGTPLVAAATRPAMGLVFAILALDVLGVGLAMPVLPTLIAGLAKLSPERVSLMLGIAIASYSAMQFLCAPLLGALSDRYGRRVVLLIALVGMAVSNWIVAFAGGLASLLIGRALAGAAAANVSTVMAYIADVSDGERRTHLYGSAGSVIAVGLVAGPIAGGWLASFNPHLPFVAAGLLAALNALGGALYLPESLRPENRRAFDWRRAQPVGSLLALFRNRALRPYLLASVSTWAAYGVFQSCFVLANEARYGWSVVDASWALAALAFGMAVSQRFLVRRLTARLSGRAIIVLGYGCCCGAYLCYFAAAAPWLTYAGIAMQALGLVAEPAMRGELSRHASGRHQGELQGGLASLLSLVGAVAPLFGASAFAAAVRAGGGAAAAAGWPFAIGAALYVLALAPLARRPATDGADPR
ncbi:tetracycline resistance MFS efflux pump [Chromobacterium sp. ATCC 53434]|uniref:MFS transporter n=1 Tax=Chromobacterium sp. (strain ATCC 53434 / SC 14030) TaxID=2059672 RepID=UPI000C75ECA7|nr:MFS transporter [Chromobacterium sp. ATCC 53434]AUH49613.1 tetracycline resistance MFS efflux pump [Chromobacterium sp. ATCC 53434]